MAERYPLSGGDVVPDADRTMELPSPLTAAMTAAMPGLEYMHDTNRGQTCEGVLPTDHPYFPGARYMINNFYFGNSRQLTPGYGAWSVAVHDAAGERLMRGAVKSDPTEAGYEVQLVRPARGAVLDPIDDPVLEGQVASVLKAFAGDFAQFIAAQEAGQTTTHRASLLRRLLGRTAA